MENRKTLLAQPLIFRGLFFDGERGTSDTEASEVPRRRAKFDIEKARVLNDQREGFENSMSEPLRPPTKKCMVENRGFVSTRCD